MLNLIYQNLNLEQNKMAEENFNEEPVFKIADRRKFNPDGSLREGVNLEESRPQAETTPPLSAQTVENQPSREVPPQPAAIQEPAAFDDAPEQQQDIDGNDELNEADIPGAENPASFANFLLSLASQAAAAMGLAENPMTGKRTADLELSRYWLDVLGMLHEKTKGNLHPQEQKLFNGLLGDLRMQFVQLARMAEAQMRKQEENLMKQAAQKFSGKDILGK